MPQEYQSFSDRYPPKNRVDTGLDVLALEISDSLGKWVLDPNRAAVMAYTKKLPVLDPVGPSVLSGEPGYRYRNGDGIDIILTAEELLRFMRHDLQPKEVLKLHETYGVFYETHDDFYDEETGEAIQPMEN